MFVQIIYFIKSKLFLLNMDEQIKVLRNNLDAILQ